MLIKDHGCKKWIIQYGEHTGYEVDQSPSCRSFPIRRLLSLASFVNAKTFSESFCAADSLPCDWDERVVSSFYRTRK